MHDRLIGEIFMSEADKLLMDLFEIKREIYKKDGLNYVEFKTNRKYLKNNYIKFYSDTKEIEIDVNIYTEILKAINLKCRELRLVR